MKPLLIENYCLIKHYIDNLKDFNLIDIDNF